MKNQSKSVRILISAALLILLTAAGAGIGYSRMETVPQNDPMTKTQYTILLDGVGAERCAELAQSELVANRLVENLMLLCTGEELRQGIHAEAQKDGTVTLWVDMEPEGHMLYFGDELEVILQEELRKEAAEVTVTVTDRQVITVDSVVQYHSITWACIGGGIGLLIGLIGAIFVWKETKEKASGPCLQDEVDVQ